MKKCARCGHDHGKFTPALAACLFEHGKAREQTWPCAVCGVQRTKAQGGNVFTVCDDCWPKRVDEGVPGNHGNRPVDARLFPSRADLERALECAQDAGEANQRGDESAADCYWAEARRLAGLDNHDNQKGGATDDAKVAPSVTTGDRLPQAVPGDATAVLKCGTFPNGTGVLHVFNHGALLCLCGARFNERSQVNLPEDAARILRENLWHLVTDDTLTGESPHEADSGLSRETEASTGQAEMVSEGRPLADDDRAATRSASPSPSAGASSVPVTAETTNDDRTADELTAARAHPHCPTCRLVLEDCRCSSVTAETLRVEIATELANGLGAPEHAERCRGLLIRADATIASLTRQQQEAEQTIETLMSQVREDARTIQALKVRRVEVAQLAQDRQMALDEIATLRQQLAEAIAHDRQPYPTAAAYERVCALLAEARSDQKLHAIAADNTRDELQRQLAEARKPGVTVTLANQYAEELTQARQQLAERDALIGRLTHQLGQMAIERNEGIFLRERIQKRLVTNRSDAPTMEAAIMDRIDALPREARAATIDQVLAIVDRFPAWPHGQLRDQIVAICPQPETGAQA